MLNNAHSRHVQELKGLKPWFFNKLIAKAEKFDAFSSQDLADGGKMKEWQVSMTELVQRVLAQDTKQPSYFEEMRRIGMLIKL